MVNNAQTTTTTTQAQSESTTTTTTTEAPQVTTTTTVKPDTTTTTTKSPDQLNEEAEKSQEDAADAGRDNAVAEPANDPVLGNGENRDIVEQRDEALADARSEAMVNHAKEKAL